MSKSASMTCFKGSACKPPYDSALTLMPSTTRQHAKRIPAGAWHAIEARWGDSQRVRLVTGGPSFVTDPIHIRSIHVVGFVDSGRQVLLVQNKDQSWTFPGGRLEGCETLREALDREVWEEARAAVAPDFTSIAATRIEFLNRVPGRVYRVHPSFLLWVTADIATLSNEPHHDPADSVIGRLVTTPAEAHLLLAPLEQSVLAVALARRGAAR
jgi:8-oxo-dGTP pyrophosphatase MutT (NUDIX family)